MSKLTQIVSILDDKDTKIISSLMATPLFNGQKRHQAMLSLASSGKIKDADFTQEERKTMSELFQMIERYLVIRHADQDALYTQKTLLSTYRHHENEKLFQAALNRSKTKQTSEDFEFKAALTMEEWQFGQLKSRFGHGEVDQIIHNDDVAAIIRKLKQIIALGAQATLTSRQLDLGLFAHIDTYIQERGLLELPVINVYYCIYKLIFFPNEENWFDSFSEAFQKHEDSFDNESIKSIYFPAINYCIRRFNSGDKKYGEILLQYYLNGLNKNYLLTNGFLSRNTYRNINTVAIRLDHLSQAIDISAQYAHLLRPEEKETAYQFNLANIYYAQQNYVAALDSIQQVNFDDHLSNLFAKTLLLKIYFETHQERLLDSHLDAMQVYLIRQKILGYHKTNYANIIKYTRKMVRLNPYDKNAKETLVNQIREEKILTDRDWLLRQLT